MLFQSQNNLTGQLCLLPCLVESVKRLRTMTAPSTIHLKDSRQKQKQSLIIDDLLTSLFLFTKAEALVVQDPRQLA